MWLCPYCESANQDKHLQCIVCEQYIDIKYGETQYCTNCGTSYIVCEDSHYCIKCGIKLSECDLDANI